MSDPATQLAAVAAFLADFPELEPIAVQYDRHRGSTEVHVFHPELSEWLDALEILPPADADWLPFGHEGRTIFTIPATTDRPFSVFALASPEYVRGLREAGAVA